MTRFIEAVIDREEVSFYVDVRVHDASYTHEYGAQEEIDVHFEIDDCEGCSESQALEWCKAHEDKLIEQAMA